MIHEEKTREVTTVPVVLYVIKNLWLHFLIQNIELYLTTNYIFMLLQYNK
jgi:hypothetical protein